LIEKITPVVGQLGYALRDVEVMGSARAPTVRVTLDLIAPTETNTQVCIEDCTKVHQALSPMFDVWDPFPGNYTLEVSSPGEKPSLRLLPHFEQAKGHKIKVQTVEPLEMPAPAKPRRNFDVELTEIDPQEGVITVSDSLGKHRIPLNLIKSAVWDREWTLGNPKPGQKRNS
jgi:ribosome maturation factor RimP